MRTRCMRTRCMYCNTLTPSYLHYYTFFMNGAKLVNSPPTLPSAIEPPLTPLTRPPNYPLTHPPSSTQPPIYPLAANRGVPAESIPGVCCLRLSWRHENTPSYDSPSHEGLIVWLTTDPASDYTDAAKTKILQLTCLMRHNKKNKAACLLAA